MWQPQEVFKVFDTLNLRQTFWKRKAFLGKLESCFLVESTSIENITFSYKIVLSEASVTADVMTIFHLDTNKMFTVMKS